MQKYRKDSMFYWERILKKRKIHTHISTVENDLTHDLGSSCRTNNVCEVGRNERHPTLNVLVDGQFSLVQLESLRSKTGRGQGGEKKLRAKYKKSEKKRHSLTTAIHPEQRRKEGVWEKKWRWLLSIVLVCFGSMCSDKEPTMSHASTTWSMSSSGRGFLETARKEDKKKKNRRNSMHMGLCLWAHIMKLTCLHFFWHTTKTYTCACTQEHEDIRLRRHSPLCCGRCDRYNHYGSLWQQVGQLCLRHFQWIA